MVREQNLMLLFPKPLLVFPELNPMFMSSLFANQESENRRDNSYLHLIR